MAQLYFASTRIVELILFCHVLLLVIWLLVHSDYDWLLGEAEYLG